MYCGPLLLAGSSIANLMYITYTMANWSQFGISPNIHRGGLLGFTTRDQDLNALIVRDQFLTLEYSSHIRLEEACCQYSVVAIRIKRGVLVR